MDQSESNLLKIVKTIEAYTIWLGLRERRASYIHARILPAKGVRVVSRFLRLDFYSWRLMVSSNG
jgi:hypothetical protein